MAFEAAELILTAAQGTQPLLQTKVTVFVNVPANPSWRHVCQRPYLDSCFGEDQR